MTTQTLPVGTRTSHSMTGYNSLANVTYCVSAAALDLSAIDPLDVIIEVDVSPGTVATNKQLQVFIKTSLDNTNFSTGPETGTTTTDQPNLIPLGSVPTNTNSTVQRRAFSVFAALGWVPPYLKVVLFNDTGAALAASANVVNYSTIVGNSA